MTRKSIKISRNESYAPLFVSPNSSFEKEPTILEKQLVSERINTDSSFEKTPKESNPEEFFFKLLKALAAKEEIEHYNNVINSLVNQLTTDLLLYSDDEENFLNVEHRVCEIEHKYSFVTMGAVLQTIYVNYNDKPKMLVGICKSLCRYDLREVMPWGPTMLAGLLNNKSEIVKEHAIELVENWSDTSMLPLLKNLEVSSKWLKDYIQDVINNLEG